MEKERNIQQRKRESRRNTDKAEAGRVMEQKIDSERLE